MRRFGEQHLGHAFELGGGLRGRARAVAGDQHVDVAAERAGGRQRLLGGIGQSGIRMLGEQENRHQITPASDLSLATSSATS